MQKVINLTSKRAKSDVWYEITTFPDGEPHIVLEPKDLDRKCSYVVICRITNPNELFILMQVGDILNRQGVEWTLTITYLMSQRMDRVINFEEAFSLKLVADVINSIHPKSVSIFEPHSERAISLIENSSPMDMSQKFSEILKGKIICYPDAGAAERYLTGEHHEGYIIMEKERDLQDKGRIKSLKIKTLDQMAYESARPIIISDDLCDGGGTFVWAADILKKEYPNRSLEILVRHMVNPAGLARLAEKFDHVYITNSYKDWSEKELPENVVEIKLF
jgi:ribose-phosphate pyrophosphokinase